MCASRLLHVGGGLYRTTVLRANCENPFLSPEALYPFAIAPVIPFGRMAQAAGMRMHDANNSEATICLPNNQAAKFLGSAVETHVGIAGIAVGSRRERCQGDHLIRFAQPQKQPAGFFPILNPLLVQGKLLKKRPGDAVGQDHALQRQKRLCRGARALAVPV